MTAEIMQALIMSIFSFVEIALFSIMLIKATVYTVYKRLRRKVYLSRCFWFYIFFCIAYILNSLLHIVVANVADFEKYRSILDYAINIFYTSSFLYLQIYTYKVVTIFGQEDFYTGDIGKKSRSFKRVERVIVIYSSIYALLEVMLISLFPLFKENPDLDVSMLSCICIFVSILCIATMMTNTVKGKVYLKKWLIFAVLSFLVLPCSIVADHFSSGFSSEMIEYQVLAMVARSLFLCLRFGQMFSLTYCAFSKRDMELLCYV